MTSSHYCTAERQYRMPVPYGSQRTPYRPVDGHRLRLLYSGGSGGRPLYHPRHLRPHRGLGHHRCQQHGGRHGPRRLRHPAAHFTATATGPEDYDLIVTGDLGLLGHQIVTDLFRQDGVDMTKNYTDCGLLL